MVMSLAATLPLLDTGGVHLLTNIFPSQATPHQPPPNLFRVSNVPIAPSESFYSPDLVSSASFPTYRYLKSIRGLHALTDTRATLPPPPKAVHPSAFKTSVGLCFCLVFGLFWSAFRLLLTGSFSCLLDRSMAQFFCPPLSDVHPLYTVPGFPLRPTQLKSGPSFLPCFQPSLAYFSLCFLFQSLFFYQ